MYFADLTLCTYGRGATNPDSWNVPLLAIGWLETGSSFSVGDAGAEVIDRARKFRDATEIRLSSYNYRGLHGCDLCDSGSDGAGMKKSHINLFIPGNECVYMASGGLVHYMEEHSYLPPEGFVTALLSSSLPSTLEYEEELTVVNKGKRPELLETHDERRARRKKERDTRPDPEVSESAVEARGEFFVKIGKLAHARKELAVLEQRQSPLAIGLRAKIEEKERCSE